ncbi:MAG: hypothetical protein AAGI01_00635 [Myxococcota bacterium]
MVDDRQLAEELMRLDIVARDQLKRGRELQLEHGTTLYEALMVHGVVEEPVLVDLAARMLNIPSVDLTTCEIPDHVANLITGGIARENRVVPIAKEGAQLLLAMIDPLDIMAMDEVSMHTSIDIQPVLAGMSDMERTIERLYANAYETTEGSWDEPLEDGSQGGRGNIAPSVPVVPDRDSSDISQEMRSRPSSLEMSFEELRISIDDDQDEAPIVQVGDGVPIFAFQDEVAKLTPEWSEPALDLGGWELDVASQEAVVPDATAIEPPEPKEAGSTVPYAKIGTAYMLGAFEEPGEPSRERVLYDDASEALELEELEELDAEELLELEDVPSDGAGAGGASVSEAFDQVFAALDEVDDPIEQSNNPTGTQVAGAGLNFARLHEQADQSQELPVHQPLEDEAPGDSDELEAQEDEEMEPELEREEEGDEPKGLAALRLSLQNEPLWSSSAKPKVDAASAPSSQTNKALPGSALGRVKVKRVEQRLESSKLRAPVVERNSYRDDQMADPSTVQVAEGSVHTKELEPEDIFDELIEESAPLLLDGSEEQGGLSNLGVGEDEEALMARTREFSERDERVRKVDPSVDDLAEETSEEPEAGQVPASSLWGPSDKPRENPLTVTQENQAITLEQIHRMKREPTGKRDTLEVALDSNAVFREGPTFDVPPDIDQERLLRAALLILIDRGVLDLDELVEVAKKLDQA